VYPIALLRTASADARRYSEFVAGPEAFAIFQKYGFSSAK
jgi:ABC-type molybdate transport system substrate-binding protein